jgi:hypothetical protein
MRRFTTVGIALVGLLVPAIAFAEITLTNKDANSYQYTLKCGSTTRDTSIAGGKTDKFSTPAGSTECTLTMKTGGTSCTVKDGGSCTIQSGKIAKQ